MSKLTKGLWRSDLLAQLKQFVHKQSFTMSLIVLAIGMTLTGYGLIKNLKSINNQSASAEQLPGTPESGARSRISELYDALVAQGKGSDTDVSGLTAAQGDWGAKWNRIKTAALKGSGGNGGTAEEDHVEFTYNGLVWSYPLINIGGRPTTRKGEYSNWSWFGYQAQANKEVNNKDAEALCPALGRGWRLPTKDELVAVAVHAKTRIPQTTNLIARRLSSTLTRSSNGVRVYMLML